MFEIMKTTTQEMARKARENVALKKTIRNVGEMFREYEVTDVNTPADFLARYYRPERYTGWGEEYAAILLSSYTEDFERDGFVIISHFDSVTGKYVSMYKEQTQ